MILSFYSPFSPLISTIVKRHKTTYMVRQAATSNPQMLDNPCFTTLLSKPRTALSQSELQHRTRFGAICQGTAARMQDASKIPADIAAFKSQRQYTTLRQYVWHQVADSMD